MRDTVKFKESKADKRQKEIINLLDEDGKVKVADLIGHLNVTAETIRRDLEVLEAENKLIRVRGGAVPARAEGFETPSLVRENKNLKEKKMIGKEACKFIKQNEIIAIDASTTGLQLAKYLKNIPLTVITNSIHISIELSKKNAITVILTGGYLRQESMSLVGLSSDKIISDYHIDKFFMSCTGADSEWGISDSHEMQAKTKKYVAELSDDIYLLADHSKFDQKSLVRWLPLEDIGTIITSNAVPEDVLSGYRKKVDRLIAVDLQ